jgi:hypothetical protein
MKLEELKMGQMYRIRAWGDMETEFGLDRDGDIAGSPEGSIDGVPACFSATMRDYCGMGYTPQSSDSDGAGDHDLLPKLPTDHTIWPYMLEEL